eukprot:gene2829-3088_t
MGYFYRRANHTCRKERKNPIPDGYQVHFSFVTRRLKDNLEVNEEYLMTKLREHYHLDVIEVILKAYKVNKLDGSQSGYGFICFDDLGQAESTIRNLRGIRLDNITFDCSLSKRSEDKINALNASASTTPQKNLPRSSSLSTELDSLDDCEQTVYLMENNAVTNMDHGHSSFHTIIPPEIYFAAIESSNGAGNDGMASAAKAVKPVTKVVLPPTAPPACTACQGISHNFVQQPPPYGGDMYYGGAPIILPPWLPNYYRRDGMVYGSPPPSPPAPSYPVNYHPSWEAQQQQQLGYQPYQTPMNPYYGQAGAHSYQHPMSYWKRA